MPPYEGIALSPPPPTKHMRKRHFSTHLHTPEQGAKQNQDQIHTAPCRKRNPASGGEKLAYWRLLLLASGENITFAQTRTGDLGWLTPAAPWWKRGRSVRLTSATTACCRGFRLWVCAGSWRKGCVGEYILVFLVVVRVR